MRIEAGSRTTATELFPGMVDSFQSLSVVIKTSVLAMTAALGPPL